MPRFLGLLLTTLEWPCITLGLYFLERHWQVSMQCLYTRLASHTCILNQIDLFVATGTRHEPICQISEVEKNE